MGAAVLQKRMGLAILMVLWSTLATAACAGDAGASRVNAKLNGGRELLLLPEVGRPIRAAIYQGSGTGQSGMRMVENRVKLIPDATVERLTAEEVGARDLSEFDLIVFSGGSGSAQSRAIGDAGRENVREFVAEGGGYLGICAGAYLACAGFDWGLGLVNAKTVSGKWRRGKAVLKMELTSDGRRLFGELVDPFQVRYNNGPVIMALEKEDLPPYRTLATFVTETAKNDSPVGVQIGSPAIAAAEYGKGRVVLISPHPEGTTGLKHMIPLAVAHLVAEE